MSADKNVQQEIMRAADALDKEIGTASTEPKDPNAKPDPSAPKEKPPLSTQQNIAAILTSIVSIIGPIFPTVKEVYNPANVKAIGEELAPMIDKRGWQNAVGFGRWEPEMRAIAIVLAVAGPTIQAAKMDLARLKAMAQGMREKPEEGADNKSDEGGAPGGDQQAGLKE